jgi:cephalosporin hydroxylase
MDWHEVARTAWGAHLASQYPDELAEALEVITKVEPSVIVEIGCDGGGTLYAWRQICDRVYGITLADNSYETGGGNRPLVDHGAVVHIGDSHDPTSVAWLRQQLDGDPVDVLIIDGDHTARGVLADFDAYSPLVRPGGLILLHDIAVTNDLRAQVHMVWPELASRYHTTKEIRSAQQPPYGWGVIRTEEPL